MEKALEQLSRQQLIALLKERGQAVPEREHARLQKQATRLEVQATHLQAEKENLEQELAYYKAQVEMYRRMQFGQKRERFEADAAQLPLPFQAPAAELEEQQQLVEEQISYVRKKQSTHKGRTPLPAHLPVEEVEIYPEGDLTQMVCIGKEVTEELECEPARFFIRRYIRYKYAPKDKEGVSIGALPERVIDKGIAGAGLLATVLVDKYCDHLPLYRQKQRFARESIPIASSTIEGWAKQAMERLEPLYEQLLFDTKAKGYLQADETPIKVLESDRKGACHQGYYWVYHSPVDGTVLFDYQPTRAAKGPEMMLSGFRGYLQTDGYGGYEKIGRRAQVTHLFCWAHSRREFEKALANDRQRAQTALLYIQGIYAVERQARESGLSPEARKELRLEKSLPLLNALGKWMAEQVEATLPRSPIGKALRYSMERWDGLCAYLYDGVLEIDNNLVENAIRPVALGRKNYLFAGSHEAAQRAAMIYSFFAICKKHQVNPYQWLKHTLQNIMSINHKNIRELYPQNFKSKSNM
jgi:transposase